MRFPFRIVRKLPKKLDLPKDLLELVTNPDCRKKYPLVIEVDYMRLSVLAGAVKAALKDGEKDITIELMAASLFDSGFATHMVEALKSPRKSDKEKSLDYFT